MASSSNARPATTFGSSWLFVLAATGAAIGLGDLWRFPYVAGENGGGAFVLVYIGCIALVGVPLMMAEVLLGRAGGQSPVGSMQRLVREHARSPAWVAIGWLGMLAGLAILSYYTVIAGWSLHYLWLMASGRLQDIAPDAASRLFDAFTGDPWLLLLWHTVFMVATIWIVARGVTRGIAAAVRWLVPLLFVVLLMLFGHAVTSGGFGAGVDYLLGIDWSALTPHAFQVALAHAFVTLGIGMGAIMAYGAYLPDGASIPRAIGLVAFLDTLVAIGAGIVILALLFANGLAPIQGPDLMFVAVPLAFGQMEMGAVFGGLFFLLVALVAITSTIALAEPALAWLVQTYNAKRPRVAITLGVLCWLLGVGTVLSFNQWADAKVVGGFNFFGAIGFISQNLMLPLCAVLIALFAAWRLPATVLGTELGLTRPWALVLWRVLVGVIAPAGVLLVAAGNLAG
jgi:NSS family neurotransmitter:Na+ symporter